MSSTLGKLDAPPAVRATRPTWRDPRLWIGVAVLAASVLLGARILGSADDTVEVWAAGRALGAGEAVDTADLVVRRVRFADDAALGHYLPVSGELPADAVLARPVAEGELLPAGALGAARTDLVEVPVWAPADAVPAGVRAGSRVDVWVLPEQGGTGRPRLVLDDVVVVAAPRGGDGFGPGATRQVVVGVPDGEPAVGETLAAARDGRVAVTRRG